METLTPNNLAKSDILHNSKVAILPNFKQPISPKIGSSKLCIIFEKDCFHLHYCVSITVFRIQLTVHIATGCPNTDPAKVEPIFKKKCMKCSKSFACFQLSTNVHLIWWIVFHDSISCLFTIHQDIFSLHFAIKWLKLWISKGIIYWNW